MVIHLQRYFTNTKQDNEFILSDNDMYHIKTVMRMKDNDEIAVVFKKKPYLCVLNNNHVMIKQELETLVDNMPYTCLIVPVLKEQKMDIILQKATELGVSEIIVYYSIRGIIKESDNNTKKLERWNRILKEASEQSHRIDIPSISINSLDKITNEGINIFCSTTEKTKNIKNILKSITIYDRINVVIGPEGGIDPKEEKLLLDNNYIPVTLGNRILRVETVPLFIMSVVNYELME